MVTSAAPLGLDRVAVLWLLVFSVNALVQWMGLSCPPPLPLSLSPKSGMLALLLSKCDV